MTEPAAACSTCPSDTPSGWDKRESSHPLGSVGGSYENALAEAINGSYNTEPIRPRGTRRHVDDVEIATLEWIHWLNHRRIMESIGNVPPVELEAACHEQPEAQAPGA